MERVASTGCICSFNLSELQFRAWLLHLAGCDSCKEVERLRSRGQQAGGGIDEASVSQLRFQSLTATTVLAKDTSNFAKASRVAEHGNTFHQLFLQARSTTSAPKSSTQCVEAVTGFALSSQ